MIPENTYEMLGSVKVWFTKGELRGAKVTLIEICKRVLETGTYCTSNCETLPKAQILARACKFMYEQLESISIMDLVSPPYQKFAQDVLEEVDSLVLTKENERLIERVDPKDILDD